ncbi:hypothetical protein K402DRAFT_331682 [Aulographum hederae CBS 113979]|uniref:Uncharacterized protein n=1 Tax=Aulographum hederae CBS 113979 TaxID=1176131 RepID=A0A6G1H134_9PEZI|nr:hypothetical protein K402DRAFT_331682 [Aulographum hederae CBS 113979]
MENNDRRQRQSNPSGYVGQQGLVQTSPQYPPVSTADRFRNPQLPAQSPTTATATARSANPPGYTGYGYGEGAQFGGSNMAGVGTMQYQAEYAPESQRSQQSQYSQYGSNMMYNVAAAQPTAAPQSPYEAVQPYQPRQSAAVEVLSSQFGVPQNYYQMPQEGGPTSAPSALGGPNVPSQYPNMSYTSQSPVGRDSIATAYSSAMHDHPQTSAHGGYGADYSSQSSDLENAYGNYQAELRKTFEYVHDGRLSEAGASLVRISEWLLGNAESLELTTGLVRDDESLHAERLKLWEDFNNCWLSTLQRQQEMTQEMLDRGHRPITPQSILEVDVMESMGKELIRLCDIMEKHGLVDYQMGVWEEEIETNLERCIDLLEGHSASHPSASTARRR